MDKMERLPSEKKVDQPIIVAFPTVDKTSFTKMIFCQDIVEELSDHFPP